MATHEVAGEGVGDDVTVGECLGKARGRGRVRLGRGRSSPLPQGTTDSNRRSSTSATLAGRDREHALGEVRRLGGRRRHARGVLPHSTRLVIPGLALPGLPTLRLLRARPIQVC